MPIILENEEQITQWLSPSTLPDTEHLIEPLRGVKSSLNCVAVNHCVNSSRNNVPECRIPLEIKDEKKTFLLFSNNNQLKGNLLRMMTSFHCLWKLKLSKHQRKKISPLSLLCLQFKQEIKQESKQEIKQEIKKETKQEPANQNDKPDPMQMSPVKKRVLKQQKLNFG